MNQWKLYFLTIATLVTVAWSSRILVTSLKTRRNPRCRGSRRLEHLRGRCMFHFECLRDRGVSIGHCFAVPGLVVGACCMVGADPEALASSISGEDFHSIDIHHEIIQSKQRFDEEPPVEIPSGIGPKITTTTTTDNNNGTTAKTTISSNQQLSNEDQEEEEFWNITSGKTTTTTTTKNPIKPIIIDDDDDDDDRNRSEIIHRSSPRPLVVNQNEFYEIVPSSSTEKVDFDDDDDDDQSSFSINSTMATPSPSTINTIDSKREKLCGIRPLRPTGRVVGGRNAQFGEWPWQVLIKESTWLGFIMKSKCGGVLIDPRWVLTAAHCQPGMMGSLIVMLGQYELHGLSSTQLRPQIKTVRRMIVHRDYDPDTFDNDIALLELDTPFEMKPHIVPICLPDEDEDYVGRYAYVAGWGKLSYGGIIPSILQTVRLPIIDNRKCQKMFTDAGHFKMIRDRFLCAGYPQGGRDTCEGDSGGPLMMLDQHRQRWTLVATVSHGIKCAEPNLPGIYMKTWSYLSWIRNIIDNRNF